MNRRTLFSSFYFGNSTTNFSVEEDSGAVEDMKELMTTAEEEQKKNEQICKFCEVTEKDCNYGQEFKTDSSPAVADPVAQKALRSLDQECTCQEDDWILLKFDEKYFKTMRSTLLLDPQSLFAAMFKPKKRTIPVSSACDADEDDKLLPLSTEKSTGAYLFDRNPKYFEPILNFLRTGDIIIDEGVSLLGVYHEAKFFQISGMIKYCEEKLRENHEMEMFKKKQKKSDLTTRSEIVKALISCPANTKLRFQGLHLKNIDLSKLDLSSINFSCGKFEGINFSDANLCNTDFSRCVLKNCNFSKAEMLNVNLSNSNLKGSTFESANLTHSNCVFCAAQNVCFRFTDLSFCDFGGAILKDSDLTGSHLKNTTLKGADLKGVNFSINRPMSGVLNGQSL